MDQLEKMLKNREEMLTEVLPLFFKGGRMPSEKLVENVLVHKALAQTPTRLGNPRNIKVDVAAVMERHGPGVECVSHDQGPKLCPLSKGVIRKEWRGRCGHTFDEEAVVPFMKRGIKKCPVFGCGKELRKE